MSTSRPEFTGKTLDRRKDRWFNPLDLRAYLLDRVFAYLLAVYISFWGNTKEDAPAAMVEHSTQGLGCLTPFTSSFLEL
jgi:hypothetical protein